MGNNNNNNGGANNNQPVKQQSQQQPTQPVKIDSGYYRQRLNDNVQRLPLVNVNTASWLIGELIDIEQRLLVAQRVIKSTLRINATLAVELVNTGWYQFTQRGELNKRVTDNVSVIYHTQREYDALANRQREIHSQLDVYLNVIKRG
jgi:hypothetical protein